MRFAKGQRVHVIKDYSPNFIVTGMMGTVVNPEANEVQFDKPLNSWGPTMSNYYIPDQYLELVPKLLSRATINEFGCHAAKVEKLMREAGYEIEEPKPQGVYVRPGDVVICGTGKVRNLVISPKEYELITGMTLNNTTMAVVNLDGLVSLIVYTPAFSSAYKDGVPVLGYAK